MPDCHDVMMVLARAGDVERDAPDGHQPVPYDEGV